MARLHPPERRHPRGAPLGALRCPQPPEAACTLPALPHHTPQEHLCSPLQVSVHLQSWPRSACGMMLQDRLAHVSGLSRRQPQPSKDIEAVLANEARRASFSALTCKPMFQSHQNPALQANLQATMRGQHLPQQGRQRPVKQQPPWHTCTCSAAVRSAALMLEATTDIRRACWCSCPCLAILKAALAAAVAKPCR